MNEEMIAFPMMVGFIVLTGVLTATFSAMLPYMPNMWSAVKTRISRVFTRQSKSNVDDRIQSLEEQVNTLAEKLAIREKHLKGNVRRIVREYLEELKK